MHPESKWTKPSRACPHPERWNAPDGASTEIEVSELVGALVKALHPDLVIETGTAFGQTAQLIGEALNTTSAASQLITFETNADRVQFSRNRCTGLPVDVQQSTSLDGIKALATRINAGKLPRIGFAWLDTLLNLRPKELRAITPLLAPGAVVGIHDCGQPRAAKYRDFSQTMADEARHLGYSRLSLPTPRGVTFLSKKVWW